MSIPKEKEYLIKIKTPFPDLKTKKSQEEAQNSFLPSPSKKKQGKNQRKNQRNDQSTEYDKTDFVIFFKTIGHHFFVLLTFLSFFSLFVCSFAGYLLWKFGRGLPDYHFLKDYQPSSITFLYDRTGRLLKTYAQEKRLYTHLSDIPPRLIQAFLAAEDKNFFTHCGIDFMGLFRAIVTNTFGQKWKKKPVGASTITQQVAKIFLVGNKQNFSRKIREAILAFRLENALTKDRILELYLNQIYMGEGCYGVVKAAQAYFRKNLQSLNLSECAFLASLPKAPSQYNPFINKEKSQRRRNWVLERMYKNQAISLDNMKEAQRSPLIVFHDRLPVAEKNSFFIEEARRELIRNFGETHTYSSGIEATLTLDQRLQDLLDQSLRHGLENYDKDQKWRGPVNKISLRSWTKKLSEMKLPKGLDAQYAVILNTKPFVIGLSDGGLFPLHVESTQNFLNQAKEGDVILVREFSPSENSSKQSATENQKSYTLFQIPSLTGGAVVLDATTGQVLAMSGGYSFDLSQFNCATQAWRQPASTFKPFVFFSALQHGFRENSVLVEKPVTFKTPHGLYSPHNYNRSVYGGPMTLKEGLAKSRNVFTVILADKIGIQNVRRTAQLFGLSDHLPRDITIALGTGETTVLRLASSYACFFNGGFLIRPTLFQNLTSHISPEKYQCPVQQKKLIIHSASERAQMKSMLRAAILEGTGRRIASIEKELPIKLYGKTGTSSHFKDAWFVCCVEPTQNTPDGLLKEGHPLIIAVFVGYPTPQSIGEHQTGSKIALPIVHHFLKKISEQYTN